MDRAAVRNEVTADQAADLLGVRLQTIYAYVSRGLLTRGYRTNEAGHRVSVLALDEVLRLAAERTRVRTGSLEVLVETDVTLLDPKGMLSFRGHDAVELSERPFEEVAELVWGSPTSGSWTSTPADAQPVAAAAAALGDAATDADRVRAAVLALATADPERTLLTSPHVVAVGRRAVAGGVAALGGSGDGPVADRLWPALGAPTPTAEGVAALNAALVLLVDHELAASTMAARIAAGTGADPWLVLLTGLAALGGPRHGRSSVAAEAVLRDGVPGLDGYAADQPVPGFGHKVYVDADPRAEVLLDHVARLDPAGWPDVEELLLAVSHRFGRSPNVDLGLAALVRACGFRPGSGETIFALSRMVGWLAHAMEEYPQGLRFRPRAVYTGDPTRAGGKEGAEPAPSSPPADGGVSGRPAAGPSAEAADRHTGHWGG
ncbi:MAG TPA: citrate/2-methylcitrate synthase [Ornithinibacter sp.]|nr:citrate/2-methylcitrate synthase [Ornithinibacter sp.]